MLISVRSFDLQQKKNQFERFSISDIENKEYVTWKMWNFIYCKSNFNYTDILNFIVVSFNCCRKEGSDSGDLEGRLSRAARAFWSMFMIKYH